jgi:hypothetical protein
MLIVFTSFLLFFGLLLWYADKHNRGIQSDGNNIYGDQDRQQVSRANTHPDFNYFNTSSSQFPLNFSKTSPRGLGYSANKTASKQESMLTP